MIARDYVLIVKNIIEERMSQYIEHTYDLEGEPLLMTAAASKQVVMPSLAALNLGKEQGDSTKEKKMLRMMLLQLKNTENWNILRSNSVEMRK
jgi:hypothetical protein